LKFSIRKQIFLNGFSFVIFTIIDFSKNFPEHLLRIFIAQTLITTPKLEWKWKRTVVWGIRVRTWEINRQCTRDKFSDIISIKLLRQQEQFIIIMTLFLQKIHRKIVWTFWIPMKEDWIGKVIVAWSKIPKLFNPNVSSKLTNKLLFFSLLFWYI
jgi:hypothetical protein